MDVYVENRRIILDPKKIIGSGGEAEIFNIGGGKATWVADRGVSASGNEVVVARALEE